MHINNHNVFSEKNIQSIKRQISQIKPTVLFHQNIEKKIVIAVTLLA